MPDVTYVDRQRGLYYPDDPPGMHPEVRPIREDYDPAAHRRELDRVSKIRGHALDISRELLMNHMSEAQLEQWRAGDSFTAVGNKTGTRYEIRTLASGNVWDDRGRTHCAVLYSVPIYDMLLAQKLTIECDEEAFLRISVKGNRRDGIWAVRQDSRQKWMDRCETLAVTLLIGIMVSGAATALYATALYIIRLVNWISG